MVYDVKADYHKPRHLDPMLETFLQAGVEDLFARFRWRGFHRVPPVRLKGRSSPGLSREGKGFPDFVAVHTEQARALIAELKRDGEKPSPDQVGWLDGFVRAGLEVYLWEPEHWHSGAVEAVAREYVLEENRERYGCWESST